MGSATSVGMDGATLDEARTYAFDEAMNTQAVVVVRRGVIVEEWYAKDASTSSFSASWSVAKSFTSTLIGIAIEDGFIESLDQPLADFLPAWKGTDKADITIKHVLTMSSGLGWDEDYSNFLSDIDLMVLTSTDHLASASTTQVQHPPGTVFSYSSGDSMLLSGVLAAATGKSVGQYAAEKLFAPLGMAPVQWWTDKAGHTLTYCCIDTPTRELAKFGVMVEQGGSFAGQQIVSGSWLREALAPSTTNPGYGYQWWLLGRTDDGVPGDTVLAWGVDDQYIYIIPSLDLVVVRSGTYRKDPGPPVADPTLFSKCAPDGLGPILTSNPAAPGTLPASDWQHAKFLAPIVRSIQGP